MSFVKAFLTHGILVVFAGVAQAADYHSPRSAALGGSGHAGPLLNDAILLNPSFQSFLPTYSVGLNYLTFSGTPYTQSSQVVEPHGRNFNVSLQDGRSELFAAGVSYTQREDGTYIHVGAAKAAIRKLGFGLGAKFFFNNDLHTSGRDMTFSTSMIAADWLQLAFIVDNIFQNSEGTRRSMYRELILGVKFNVMGIVLLYFDPHTAPDLPGDAKYGHESGIEFVVLQDLFLRLGAYRNALVPSQGRRGRGYGAGIGWVAPRISLDYGVSRMLDPVQATAHTFGATMYF
jgi:hypothetical protein